VTWKVFQSTPQAGRYQGPGGGERDKRANYELGKSFKQLIQTGSIFFLAKEEEEEFNRLPWLGQSGRAAAGCACTAAALRC
jgi:hypothetical protein